jgi:LytS/YehU family sensor histidine kinase
VNSKSLIKNTVIRFEGLRAGKYSMLVCPVINGQIDYSKKIKLAFEVPTPFWERTSFLFLAFFSVLFAIYSIWAYRRLLKKKRLEEKLAQTNETLNHKLTALKSQINPHFMSNSLAAIQGLILKNEIDAGAQYLAKFSFLMRQVLNFSEKQFISLKNELEIIDLYLEIEQLRFSTPFTIVKDYPTDLASDQIGFPSLLSQPILENAIWHGLRNVKDKKAILSLKITENQEGLFFEISDNGPGIDSVGNAIDHQSKGRMLITDRISSINKRFGENSAQVDFIDLKNTNETGTTVKFFFSNTIIDIDEEY